jgi:multidrug efflux pump subunit AcrA (membrane-fusion protein)
MMKQAKKKLLMLMMILGAVILLTACELTERAGSEASEAVEAVAVQDVEKSSSFGSFSVEGEIVPVRFAVLSFASSGVIDEVLIEEGQTAASGEIIALLEGKEQLEAAIVSTELEVLTAQQALDQLYEDTNVRRASAQQRLAEAETAYDEAKEDYERIGWSYGDQDAIDEAYAAYILAQKKVDDAQEDFEDVAHKPEDDEERAFRLSDLATARAARDRTLASLNYVKSTPDIFEVGETESTLEVARVELEEARADWEILREDGLDPDDVELAEARLKNAEAQLAAAKSDLDDVELSAPFDGALVSSGLKTGELVNSGTDQVTLADITDWKVETTDLTELDVINVLPGDEVRILVEAIPDLELAGTVERIKSIGVNKQGDVTYTVIITLDQSDPRLLWNMTTEVLFLAQGE